MAVIHFGGRFVGEAHVPILDDGYRLGDGVFATMRGYAGIPFRARSHLAQLAAGAALFDIPLPMSLDAIERIVGEAARRTALADTRIRVTLTRGPTLSVVATAMDPPPLSAYERGVDVVRVRLRAAPPACFDPSIKTTSYAPHVLARREAERRGAFEGLMLALDGSIASASMANVFLVHGRELLTPPLETGCRPGITRAVVLAVASGLGLAPIERLVTIEDLRSSDEAFLTSTRVECLRIARVDGAPVRRGTWCDAILTAFREIVRKETVSGSVDRLQGEES